MTIKHSSRISLSEPTASRVLDHPEASSDNNDDQTELVGLLTARYRLCGTQCYRKQSLISRKN